ncbi:F-box domain-containing protein [Cedratvirus kamchatka]|uniref:F-box domain-containing protein n=1 Tax=Cedratvirus kamchatka TaxID=2716914 RepID=A0A6G8MZ57_9VIRU|nr:F-box domain-containing protein [Cedratvirus kamchatka]
MCDLPCEIQVKIMSFLPCPSLLVLSETVPFSRMFDDSLWQTLCKIRYGIDKKFFLVYPITRARDRFVEIASRFETMENLHKTRESPLGEAVWQNNHTLLVKLCKEDEKLTRRAYENRNMSCLNWRRAYRTIAQELNLAFSWQERLLCFVEEGRYDLVEENIDKVTDRTLVLLKLLSQGQVELALKLKREKIEKCLLLANLLLSGEKEKILHYLPLFLSYKLRKSKKEYILSHAYASGDPEIFTYFERLFGFSAQQGNKLLSFARYYENSRNFVQFYYLLTEHGKLNKGAVLHENVKQTLLGYNLEEINYVLCGN